MQEEKDAYCGRKDTEGAKVNAVEPKEYGMLAGNLSSPTLEALGQKGEQTSDCGVLEILAVQSDSFWHLRAKCHQQSYTTECATYWVPFVC